MEAVGWRRVRLASRWLPLAGAFGQSLAGLILGVCQWGAAACPVGPLLVLALQCLGLHQPGSQSTGEGLPGTCLVRCCLGAREHAVLLLL